MQDAILQLGTPSELYERPANVKVAQFIGSPAINFLPGARGAMAAPSSSSGIGCRSTVDLPAGSALDRRDPPGGDLTRRPGSIVPRPAQSRGRCSASENLGPEFILHLAVGDARIPVVGPIAAGPTLPEVDERAGAAVQPHRRATSSMPDGKRIEARPVDAAPLRSARAFPVGERVSHDRDADRDRQRRAACDGAVARRSSSS